MSCPDGGGTVSSFSLYAEPILATASNTGAGTTITLNWSGGTATNSYTVYRNNVAVSPAVTGHSFTDPTGNDVVNYYRVISNLGERSNDVRGSTPLAAPVIQTTSTNTFGNTINYSSIPSALSYQIYRAASANGPFTLITSVATTTFTDRAWIAGATYYYVEAFGVASSGPSNTVEVTNNNPPVANSLYIALNSNIWRVDGTSGNSLLALFTGGEDGVITSGTLLNNLIYFVCADGQLSNLNPTNGTQSFLGASNDWVGNTAVTSAVIGGPLYLLQTLSGTGHLWQDDPSSGIFTELGTTNWPVTPPALVSLGTALYSTRNSTLYNISASNGASVQVGPNNAWPSPVLMSTANFLLYIISAGSLYQVDPNTGVATNTGSASWGSATAIGALNNSLYIINGDHLYRVTVTNGVSSSTDLGPGWTGGRAIVGY